MKGEIMYVHVEMLVYNRRESINVNVVEACELKAYDKKILILLRIHFFNTLITMK